MALVMVVEDDREEAEHLRAAIRLSGYRSIVVPSAGEARQALDTLIPDLVLVDVNLPGDCGEEVCMELRRRYSKMPIVVMSALSEAWNEDDLRACAADAILAKPVDLSVLARLFDRYLERAGND